MGSIARKKKRKKMQRRCNHQWVKTDKEGRFRKKGKYEVKRVQEKCIRCNKERIREIKRRYK